MWQCSEDVWRFQEVRAQAYIAKYLLCSAKTYVIDTAYLNNLMNMIKYFHAWG